MRHILSLLIKIQKGKNLLKFPLYQDSKEEEIIFITQLVSNYYTYVSFGPLCGQISG